VFGGDLRVLAGGAGPPVLLLHGDPQTHLCWRAIAPTLARERTVVLADLPGRGESGKPGASADHAVYAKGTMARQMRDLMASLGYARFDVVGHDRGARVARRLALDHPEVVRSVSLLDIVPEIDLYDGVTAEIAQAYFYFFFLTQPAPRPERLIAGDPEAFMHDLLTGLGGKSSFPGDVLDLYIRASATPEAITAMCECFRAGATLDIAHDRTDRAAGRRLEPPALVIWGAQSVVGRNFDVPALLTPHVRAAAFKAVEGGHFLPEDAAEQVLDALSPFLEAPETITAA